MTQTDPRQWVVLATPDDPLVLDSGSQLTHVEVAYETWGTLNDTATNAIFIPHALTGDSHASGTPESPGWWDTMVGPGKPVDTDRFFVICPNLLAGCRGTTGPLSVDPATGRPYGLDFPLISISDFVQLHRRLIRHLKINRLLACVGGSLGGMQALQWAVDAPEEMAHAVVVAASSRLSAQNIAFSAVARSAIMRDPAFNSGRYFEDESSEGPRTGLAVARMMAHITYLSEEAMQDKFGRRIQDAETPRLRFGVDFAVESYLEHQGSTFLDRFDPLSYIYLSRALDYYDVFADPHWSDRLQAAPTKTEFLVMSFDSDWRFSTDHSRRITRKLEQARQPVSFREIRASHGHDSFLLDVPDYLDTVKAFLDHAAEGVLDEA
ncbi:MAG TPA: homoserine O-acetyltransferase [Marmoricola sp.]|nr:homoserine O-acetyltransferase [Nocardioidaceae bacterium]MCB8993274.1 homoserine O-acetyltransferase [Nocardioidaceae bacterium]MCO5324562.1 homoserine O-acetyltransferase [Nocardioidaceae bacterium]HRV69392.1 homoserine O-acetyltransferase [Marmoricola sp.]